MTKTFSFICATQEKESTGSGWTNRPNYTKWELGLTNFKDNLFKFDQHIIYENSRGLSEIYNEYFDKLESDYVICIHDDVRIDDINFFDKIEDYSSEFDIMGVAGGCNFSFKRYERLSWMSVLDQRNDLAGCVQHSQGKDPKTFSSCCYGSVPRKTLSIDGLIMIFNKKAYKSIKFDSQFKFDFYDLDLCFTAYRLGLNVGVIPLNVTHFSRGEGLLKDSYLESQKVFIEKWNK